MSLEGQRMQHEDQEHQRAEVVRRLTAERPAWIWDDARA
jgi:hypothetical protein